MKHHTLVCLFAQNFTLTDIDVLVKNKQATYGKKSGVTTIVCNINDAAEYLNAREELKKYNYR